MIASELEFDEVALKLMKAGADTSIPNKVSANVL